MESQNSDLLIRFKLLVKPRLSQVFIWLYSNRDKKLILSRDIEEAKITDRSYVNKCLNELVEFGLVERKQLNEKFGSYSVTELAKEYIDIAIETVRKNQKDLQSIGSKMDLELTIMKCY